MTLLLPYGLTPADTRDIVRWLAGVLGDLVTEPRLAEELLRERASMKGHGFLLSSYDDVPLGAGTMRGAA